MTFLEEVKGLLSQAQRKPVAIPKEILNMFLKDCKQAVEKQFTQEREKEFRIRMSSIGKPLCQLQMEKSGAQADAPSYNSKMRFIFGDLVEALAVAILKSSGIKIDAFQKKVTHKFNDKEINGTYDVKIMDKVWDIKSASPYSFKYKFSEGFDAVAKEDTFGYVSQGYLYSEAEGADFGGWIVIDKSSGEWSVVETPINDRHHAKKALEHANNNLKALNNNEPFKRQYEDIKETFNGKPTGNKVLGKECSFCAYKKTCWENLQYLPQQQSKAMNPKYYWYTKLNNPKEEHDNSSQ